jgi:hypothetical protein
MPPIAAGVLQTLRYKAESSFGTAPGASGAQLLRRVSADLSLEKDTFESAEIRPDLQRYDYRHGVRKVTGSIKGELSPGTYKDFLAAALRRAFTAVTALSGLTITIAGAGPTYTLTRSAGDFLAGGIKIGHVVQLTAGSFTAGNLNKNLLVVGVTALALTVYVLNGSTLTTEGPIASATVTVPGKVTYAPTSGHLDNSFAIERWYSDVSLSELFTGCKVATVDVNLPPSGMAEIDLGIMGQNITTAGAQYYTSPTAATGTGIVAAANGLLLAGGSNVAYCTGMKFKINGEYSSSPVVGANQVPAIFPGRINVDGELTAYFQDAVMRDYFINETEVALLIALSSDNSANSNVLTFAMPRIKFGAARKSDGVQGLVMTLPFEALFNAAGGTGIATEQTTLLVQDSQA